MVWRHILINTPAKLNEAMNRTVQAMSKLEAGAFDTETTGLHPVLDLPFLFQCGWCTEGAGDVYIVDIERTPMLAKSWIRIWYRLAKKFPIYLGHHIVYDMHMMCNIGLPMEGWTNLSDTQYWIRAGSDAVQTEYGGEPLGLKPWATKHINKNAAMWEHDLATERTEIAKRYNDQLLAMTGWKKGKFNEFFKDKTNDYTDLPSDIQVKYLEWFKSLPKYLQQCTSGTVDSDDIRYSDLNRDKVIEYGYRDIEYTLECYLMCRKQVLHRDNLLQVQLEQEQIYPLYRMERVGFLVDKNYLDTCKQKLKNYIRTRRHDLCTIAGEPMGCMQNAAIQRWLTEHGVQMESTGAEALQLKLEELEAQYGQCDIADFIKCVSELRTLEKWYSTYIRKFEVQLSKSNRIYTSIHQVETVSGRISCDFQQFPKAGLKSISGEELFDPRRMVIVDKEYPAIIYLDYSAQELRVQSLYTYLIGKPDLNMMRAYSPYKCKDESGHLYDPENPEDRARAYSTRWFLEENGEPWKPTDLHGAMTHTIFPELKETDPEWHDMRYVGKRVNFAKNYGASYKRIRQMFPHFSDDICHRIDEAYYKTFPGVKAYHEACDYWAQLPYMDNLYGVKYYGTTAHKLINILVQGTSAYMTKNRVAALDKFIIDHKLKSKFVMQIHDEVQIYWHKDDDPALIWEIQKLMQDIDSQVPIVSDLEIATTTWKEKQEIDAGDNAKLFQVCNWYRPFR